MLALSVAFIAPALNHLHAEDKLKNVEKNMDAKKLVLVEESHIAENLTIEMLKLYKIK
jgi:hypothetical protein